MSYEIILWYLQESNQGHTDFQSVALPTELRYLLLFSKTRLAAGANINLFYRSQNKKMIL
jgi:type III pantothenate kinase